MHSVGQNWLGKTILCGQTISGNYHDNWEKSRSNSLHCAIHIWMHMVVKFLGVKLNTRCRPEASANPITGIQQIPLKYYLKIRIFLKCNSFCHLTKQSFSLDPLMAAMPSLVTFRKARWARRKKKWKENHATKVTKIPNTKRRKCGMNKTFNAYQ